MPHYLVTFTEATIRVHRTPVQHGHLHPSWATRGPVLSSERNGHFYSISPILSSYCRMRWIVLEQPLSPPLTVKTADSPNQEIRRGQLQPGETHSTFASSSKSSTLSQALFNCKSHRISVQNAPTHTGTGWPAKWPSQNTHLQRLESSTQHELQNKHKAAIFDQLISKTVYSFLWTTPTLGLASQLNFSLVKGSAGPFSLSVSVC